MRIFSALFCISIFLVAAHVQAQRAFGRSGSMGFFNEASKKAEAKKESRWTLQEWLGQKERNRQMDLWLLMHTPQASPFETFFTFETGTYERATDVEGIRQEEKSFRLLRGGFSAFAGLAGLEGRYDSGADDQFGWDAQFSFRLYGGAYQGTHIILFYGVRNREEDTELEPDIFQNQYSGVDVNLYVTQFFGLLGRYAYIFKENSERQVSLEGRHYEAGAFIDYSFMRVFGRYTAEFLTLKGTSPSPEKLRKGLSGGLQFFF